MESWGFRFEGYQMWCGFISLDQFRFKGRVIEGTQTFDLFLLREVSFVSRVWWGGQGKTDWIERRCLLYSLPLNDGRSQERKEGLEPSTSALARLCSTIKLFPPATVVAKHY